jgi:uncharacterized membrane protein YhhN
MPRVVIILFGVFALLNIVASGAEYKTLELVTKPFLLPLLALWVFLVQRWASKGLIVALLFSAAGDIALNVEGDLWFMIGMGLFFCAHIAYIVTFVKAGARPKPLVAAGYLVFLAAMLAWLWNGLDAMAIPMTVYALGLTTTAVLSTAFNWRTALGGALFLISDLLIAIRVAGAAGLPADGAWVMLTYCAAQFLLATGFVAHLNRSGQGSQPVTG